MKRICKFPNRIDNGETNHWFFIEDEERGKSEFHPLVVTVFACAIAMLISYFVF